MAASDKRKVQISGGAGLIGTILNENLWDTYDMSSLDLKPSDGMPSTVAS